MRRHAIGHSLVLSLLLGVAVPVQTSAAVTRPLATRPLAPRAIARASTSPDTITVMSTGDSRTSTGATVRTIADGVRLVARGGVVLVRAGVYREPTIMIAQPLTLVGEPGAVIDGEGRRELMVIGADSVVVRGMTFRNTGSSQATDRSALRVVEASD